MAYCGYVVKVKNLKPHSNADKLQVLTVFGNDTCVSLDVKIDNLGVYFPTDGQLSMEFCLANHLLRKLPDGTPDTGYMEHDKRNVKTIKLRGEKSDGIYLPISCLEPFGDVTKLNEGDTIDVFNGHEICKKYIPRGNSRIGHPSEGNRTRKKKAPIAPLFTEHADTEQLAYNLGAFKSGDEIEITLKMHGTSQRTAYLPVLKGYKCTLWDKITRKEGTPIYDWGYVSGTRRTVLENYDGGYYGSNEFREQHSKFFEGKLWKGETVYYEVTSYTPDGKPIMASGKVPKEYQSQYGKVMEFSYGMESGQSDMYVYRMTMTNEDGDMVEYTPDFMRYRCEQMGVKTVPVMWKGIIPNENYLNIEYSASAGEYIKMIAEQYYDGPDPVGKTHVREGVVVRIINRPKFCAYKHKNWLFKCVSGIITEAVANGEAEVNEEILAEL